MDEVIARELSLPVAVRGHVTHVDGAVLPAVRGEISLGIARDVVRTFCPRHSTSRGCPTFSDRSLI